MKYAPCATIPNKVLNVISSDFCASVFTVYMTGFFFNHSFDYHRGGGSCVWYSLLFSLTPFLPPQSPPPLSLPLLLLLSSGFKRLSSSLAPRSNWPLPFICQPFDVVPAWAACYGLPLTARPGVRGGLCFRTPPKLITPSLPPIHNHHLPPPLQMCLSLMPPSPPPSALPWLFPAPVPIIIL